MSDELDLGIEPEHKTPQHTEVQNRTWAKYTALARRYCDICILETPKVGGVPVHVIPRALFTEDGPDGRLWLCEQHRSDRVIAHDLALANERKAKSMARLRRKR